MAAKPMLHPESPVTDLTGVTARHAPALAKLGITNVQDAVFHLPYRFQDRTRIQPIASVQAGEECLIAGVIQHLDLRPARTPGSGKVLLCAVADHSGTLVVRFFHFNSQQLQQLAIGLPIRCFGEVRWGFHGLEMVHPEYRLGQTDSEPPAAASGLTPVYPASNGISQAFLRRLAEQALAVPMTELLPESLLCTHGLPELQQALRFVHQPPPECDTEALLAGRHPMFQRLAFEELLAHHLSLRLLRHEARRRYAPALGNGATANGLRQRLLATLPFTLTDAQHRAWREIEADLAQAAPMQRLLQGDVGSGKTVIAALAAAQAMESQHQVVVMAPTELLAEQHLRTFSAWLEPLGITPVWLAGSLSKKQRAPVLTALADGSAPLALGTHALFQEGVNFARLGLVIIDEQHRFGVHQRLALRDKGANNGLHPHQLIMTATPIPRTLAMTAYADLDVSVIDQLPPGRTPVTTVTLPNTRRADVVARVAAACRAGRQAYWVCPLIEESEVLQCQAAEDTAAQLSQDLPDLRIGLAHGRMKSTEKESVMTAFKAGQIDLLVATTIIEVGVDVPNASLMIIENAERMGLAQLHQLRGRVGRGTTQSFCVLMYQPPLSAVGKIRLATVRGTQDGFVISQKDLELRGPGEVLGTRQTGLAQMRIADLQRDQDMLARIAHTAEQLLRDAPHTAPLLIKRWVRAGWAYGGVG